MEVLSNSSSREEPQSLLASISSPNSIKFLTKVTWKHVAVAVVVYYASLVFYRLYLHPLAKFPGPKIAAISRWYEAYYDLILDGQYTFKIEKMHKQYGPIIRISPYELHINDPLYFEKLFRQDGRWDKYAWSYDAFGAPLSAVSCSPHDLHRRRRAPMNNFFSKSNVAGKQNILKELVEKLCQRIDAVSGTQKTINLGHAISAFTRDASTNFIVGKSYNNLDKEDFNQAMTKTIVGLGMLWRITKHIRWVGPLLLSLPTSIAKAIGDEGNKAFFVFLENSRNDTKNIMAASMAENPDPDMPHTLVHDIMKSKLPDAEKRLDRVYEEVTSVTGAGYESTASVLRQVLYYVWKDPAMLARLRAEIAAARQEAGTADLSVSALEQLPYLTAVIMEGLRLSPSVASRLARVAPDRDLFYDKWCIPRGTPVGMTTLLMHRNEDLYPEPSRFNPERWMDLDLRKKSEKTFAPFSRGTRNCIGMYLAWAELYLVTSALIMRFNFEFDGAGPKDVEIVSDQFIVGVADPSGIKAWVTRYGV
ncbi:trichodiene oxygenase [Biscogniauxia sp. FL1348]|nr:trichodiene oxygenase [Biscogniauxia sp. FL1348]